LEGGRPAAWAAFARRGATWQPRRKTFTKPVSALRRTANQGRPVCGRCSNWGIILPTTGDLQRGHWISMKRQPKPHNPDTSIITSPWRAIITLTTVCCLGQIGAGGKICHARVKVAEAYYLLAALLHLYSTRGEIHLYLGEWKKAEAAFPAWGW